MNRATGTFLALVVAFGFLSLQLVLPFVQYVLLALLLAYVLLPLRDPLADRTTPSIAAFILVLLALTGFVVPIAALFALIGDNAVRWAQGVDPESIQLADVESAIEETTGYEVDLAAEAASASQEIAAFLVDQTTTYFALATHTLLGLGLTLFLLYYLLKDSDRLLAWLHDVTPLPPDLQRDLFARIDAVMRAVLLGHVFIAFVQGSLAGLGLFAMGVPNAAFWTVVMMVLALVPLVGAFLVWGPAALYLFLVDEPVLAAALFVYSLIIVSVSDDYLRPIVVDRYARLNPAVIILGVLGGAYAFGVMGLFYGPVVLGALIATVETVDDYWDRQDQRSA
ncbi:AI-2E family transporter [Halovivax limisalsi]|uniref:AI-2E family transporter n=1 Tax=Halovivax limisalsi TaxID=1453760 RepID=UPI001FFCB35E|nr:AI-2E family transporter [Halovivax limisalsi]